MTQPMMQNHFRPRAGKTAKRLCVALLAACFAVSAQAEWISGCEVDEMDDSKHCFAASERAAPLRQPDFPYQDSQVGIGVSCTAGEKAATVGILFNHPVNLSQCELKSTGDCGYVLRWRWDDDAPKSYEVTSRTGKSAWVSADQDDFLRELLDSDKLRVRMPYPDGQRDIVWDTSGAKEVVVKTLAECGITLADSSPL